MYKMDKWPIIPLKGILIAKILAFGLDTNLKLCSEIKNFFFLLARRIIQQCSIISFSFQIIFQCRFLVFFFVVNVLWLHFLAVLLSQI